MRSHLRETLPPSWGLAEVTDERIVYRCATPPVEVVAVRTSADHTDPALGVGQCWEIRCQYAVGEARASDPIGRVSTRQHALERLLECMHCVHDSWQESGDRPAVRRLRSAIDCLDFDFRAAYTGSR